MAFSKRRTGNGSVLPLDHPLPPNAFESIGVFRARFQELWNNWESLKAAGCMLGGTFHNLGADKISGPGCGVEIHRLKGFYLDFRPFWAAREPTQYFKIAGIIGQHCANRGLRACLSQNKNEWKDAGFLQEWHSISADELMDVLFNGDLFHNDREKRARRLQLKNLMSDDLVHNCLFHSVFRRMLVVRNLNWIMQPLVPANQSIRLPIEYAG